MPFTYKTGRVKFFVPAKGYGFLIPDERRPDGRDVHFGERGFSAVFERWPGEIDFSHDGDFLEGKDDHRVPKAGERVAYNEYEDKRGPTAIFWNWVDEIDRCQKEIAGRPDPCKPLYRFMVQLDPRKLEVKIHWEGYDLDGFLKSGGLNLELPRSWFERKFVHGWERVPPDTINDRKRFGPAHRIFA